LKIFLKKDVSFRRCIDFMYVIVNWKSYINNFKLNWKPTIGRISIWFLKSTRTISTIFWKSILLGIYSNRFERWSKGCWYENILKIFLKKDVSFILCFWINHVCSSKLKIIHQFQLIWKPTIGKILITVLKLSTWTNSNEIC